MHFITFENHKSSNRKQARMFQVPLKKLYVEEWKSVSLCFDVQFWNNKPQKTKAEEWKAISKNTKYYWWIWELFHMHLLKRSLKCLRSRVKKREVVGAICLTDANKDSCEHFSISCGSLFELLAFAKRFFCSNLISFGCPGVPFFTWYNYPDLQSSRVSQKSPVIKTLMTFFVTANFDRGKLQQNGEHSNFVILSNSNEQQFAQPLKASKQCQK